MLKALNLNSYNLNTYAQLTHELKKLTKLETLYLNDKLMERDNGRPFFSFTRKNSIDKKTKKELRDMNCKSKKSPKRRSPRKSPSKSKRRSPLKSPRKSPRKYKRRSPRN